MLNDAAFLYYSFFILIICKLYQVYTLFNFISCVRHIVRCTYSCILIHFITVKLKEDIVLLYTYLSLKFTCCCLFYFILLIVSIIILMFLSSLIVDIILYLDFQLLFLNCFSVGSSFWYMVSSSK